MLTLFSTLLISTQLVLSNANELIGRLNRKLLAAPTIEEGKTRFRIKDDDTGCYLAIGFGVQKMVIPLVGTQWLPANHGGFGNNEYDVFYACDGKGSLFYWENNRLKAEDIAGGLEWNWNADAGYGVHSGEYNAKFDTQSSGDPVTFNSAKTALRANIKGTLCKFQWSSAGATYYRKIKSGATTKGYNAKFDCNGEAPDRFTIELFQIAVPNPPEPECKLDETYGRAIKTPSCPSGSTNTDGLFCYENCRSGYKSFTGWACIEDSCPSGYGGYPLCTKVKTCRECTKICVPFTSICHEECANLPCGVDAYVLKTYGRKQVKKQCPSDYSLVVGDLLCYQNCKSSFMEAGPICTCDISEYAKVVDNFVDDLNDQIKSGVNDVKKALQPILDFDPKELKNKFDKAGSEVLKFMTPFVDPIKTFVTSIVPGNGKVLSLEISASVTALGNSVSAAVGFVFDIPNNKQYYYISYCKGVDLTTGAGVAISLIFNDGINSIGGTSTDIGASADLIKAVSGDIFISLNGPLISTEPRKIEAFGFGIGLGVGASPVSAGIAECKTPIFNSF